MTNDAPSRSLSTAIIVATAATTLAAGVTFAVLAGWLGPRTDAPPEEPAVASAPVTAPPTAAPPVDPPAPAADEPPAGGEILLAYGDDPGRGEHGGHDEHDDDDRDHDDDDRDDDDDDDDDRDHDDREHDDDD